MGGGDIHHHWQLIGFPVVVIVNKKGIFPKPDAPVLRVALTCIYRVLYNHDVMVLGGGQYAVVLHNFRQSAPFAVCSCMLIKTHDGVETKLFQKRKFQICQTRLRPTDAEAKREKRLVIHQQAPVVAVNFHFMPC